MQYFKVLTKFDGYRRNFRDTNCTTFVANELYTKKEIDAIGCVLHVFTPVEISSRKTYFLFGARFELK